MFTKEHLTELVECSATALKAENEYVEKCYSGKPDWNNDRHGLRENTNEHYYQSIIWRGLLKSSIPWRPEIESGGNKYDLVFYDDRDKAVVAVGEIKGYWRSDGTDISGILGDLRKLRLSQSPGVMIILTTHAAGKAKENYQELARILGVPRGELVIHGFPTKPWTGQSGDYKFDVIGFLVPKEPSSPA